MRNLGRGVCLSLVSAVLVCSFAFVVAGDAHASMLLAPSQGARDTGASGSFVAEPSTPDSALFMNPSGLVGFKRTTLTFSAGIIQASTEVKSTAVGYDRNDDRFAFAPSGGISIPLGPGWRAGMGLYGAVGTTFDFEAEAPNVNSDFLSDVSIGSAPFALAREITPKLWVGAELIGLFGYLRNRYTLLDPLGAPMEIKYTIRGPGLQAMVGATWKPDDAWSFGMSLATPGKVWMDGSTAIAGTRRDVELELKMPTTLNLGVMRHFGKRVDVGLAYRWTDSSTFGDSDIEYAGIKVAFVPDAKDESRIALGAAYHATEKLTLRAGSAYASRIVGSGGVSPLLFDGEDIRISTGASYAFGALEVSSMLGYAVEFSRKVSPSEALILPGKYTGTGMIFMLGMTCEL
jgi:long-subunit fatty acid transport protein